MEIFRRFLFLTLVILSAASSLSQKSDSMANFLKVYSELLSYHAQQADLLQKYPLKNPFAPVPPELIARLNPDQIKAHYKAHLESYLLEKNTLDKLNSEFAKVKDRLASLPLTDSTERPRLEKQNVALTRAVNTVRESLFQRSILANRAIRDSLKTLTPEQKTMAKAEIEKVERPKMPGVYGGSVAERQKQKADEKIFLTPVDPEFYDSQLGKKIDKDLGKARYWSYDFKEDNLFIRNENGIGKVFVKDNGSGAYIGVRTGTDFSDIRSGDEKVLSGAKGRFLTGNREEETLRNTFW
jgi:hypothetical protein